jgi:hypothetical protein
MPRGASVRARRLRLAEQLIPRGTERVAKRHFGVSRKAELPGAAGDTVSIRHWNRLGWYTCAWRRVTEV